MHCYDLFSNEDLDISLRAGNLVVQCLVGHLSLLATIETLNAKQQHIKQESRISVLSCIWS